MLSFINSKKDCSGCGACYNVCPMHCISMVPDEEGFLYPVASDACIQCGKCQSTCPSKNVSKISSTNSIQQKAYCALTKDKKTWRESASGGAFSEVCKSWVDDNVVLCGALWDGLDVEHKCIEGVENIAPLRKSKYVASNTKKVYSEIKAYLENDRKVVFCGTPCQVAGLRKYLNREYENLLLIDLICHGVGSPKVFKTCIENLVKQFGSSVSSYEFRAKKNTFQSAHLQKITLCDGREIYIKKDPYIQLFLAQDCLRPSCGANCKYRTEQRQGDITIADFYGITKVFPDLAGTKRNYSSIVVNTLKGETIIPKLKKTMTLRECNIEDIKKYNPLFYRQSWFSEKRDTFFQEFVNNPYETIEKWCSPAQIAKDSLKRKIWDILPTGFRKIILALPILKTR